MVHTQRSPFAQGALLVTLAATLAGCAFGPRRFYTAPGTTGDGVRVELREAVARNTDIDVLLRFDNGTNEVVVIDRNQLAIVVRDGQRLYRKGPSSVHGLAPGTRLDVRVLVSQAGASFKKDPGFHVRFDGVYVGGNRLNIPPMKIGAPTWDPGEVSAELQPPAAGTVRVENEGGILHRIAGALPNRLGRATNTNVGPQAQPAGQQSAASPNVSSASFTGPRRKIKGVGAKCATMPLSTVELPPELGVIMDEILLTELQTVGFEAIGREDINAMVGFEQMKDAVACDDASCISEIGNALGVDFLATGKVAKLEGTTIVTLKLMDVKAARVLARAQKMVDGGQGQLPRIIAEAVQELVTRSGL